MQSAFLQTLHSTNDSLKGWINILKVFLIRIPGSERRSRYGPNNIGGPTLDSVIWLPVDLHKSATFGLGLTHIRLQHFVCSII